MSAAGLGESHLDGASTGPAAGLDALRQRELLELAAERRVLIVGDLMIDHYVAGRVERISPEAPVPVLRVEGEESRLGGAANVGANITALGGRCALVGCAGEDAGLALLEERLEDAGIETSGIVRCGDRPTTVKTRLVARSQQVARYDREDDAAVAGAVEDALLERIEEALAGADAVALEDYNKGVLTPRVIRAVLRGARSKGIPVVVDPKRHHFFDFSGATVFKPNLRELQDALGRPPPLGDGAWLDDVRREVGAGHLLLTLGARGMILRGPDGLDTRFPATARSVYDVSGAGDTVTAVVCLALAAGGTPTEGAILANLAAGVGVGKAGVSPVSAPELLREVQRVADEAAEPSSPSDRTDRAPAGTPTPLRTEGEAG